MNQSCNALSSKAKCMYGNALKKHDYEELIKKHELSEIIHYLKEETCYKDILKDVRESQIHRGQLEQLLLKDYYIRMKKLLRYQDMKCKKFFALFIVNQEIELILHHIALMIAIQEDTLKDVPIFYDDIISFDLMKLASSKTMKEVITCLNKTSYYPILKKYEQNIDYVLLEIEMMRYYHQYCIDVIEKELKGSIKNELMMIEKIKSEFLDLSLIYRCRFHFDMDANKIKQYLMNQNAYFKASQIEYLLTCDQTSFKTFLKESKYRLQFNSGELEHVCNKYLYEKALHLLNFSNNPYCIYSAYELIAKKELDNLIHIIEGVHYELNDDELRSMIVY